MQLFIQKFDHLEKYEIEWAIKSRNIQLNWEVRDIYLSGNWNKLKLFFSIRGSTL